MVFIPAIMTFIQFWYVFSLQACSNVWHFSLILLRDYKPFYRDT